MSMSNKNALSERQKAILRSSGVAWKSTVCRQRTCMFPGCKDAGLIDSHSQSRAFALSAIADNGCVYQPVYEHGKGLRMSFEQGDVAPPSVMPTAIRKASTFNYFCSHHDNELFSHIDVATLTPDDATQVRELYLRSLSRHMEVLSDNAWWLEELNRNDPNAIQEVSEGWSDPQLAYDSDKRRYWEPFWSSKIEGVIKWKWIAIPKRLGVSVSAMYAMAGDVVGEQWFYTCGLRPLISLSVVPQFNDITHVVFTWWYEWDECMQQFSDMLDRATTESVMSLLNYIVFTKIDDYCLSPKLWNGLSERERFAVQDFLRLDWYQKDKCKLPLIISRDWAKAG